MPRAFFVAFFAALFAVPPLIAQCSITSAQMSTSCDEGINVGISGRCRASLTNAGTSPCTGTFRAAVGLPFPGTADDPQPSSSLLGSCQLVGQYTFPFTSPIPGLTSLASTAACQGSGSLAPGETVSLSARVTPAAGAVGTTNPFIVAFIDFTATNQMQVGTISARTIGAKPVNLTNCVAVAHSPGAVPSGTPFNVTWTPATGVSSYTLQSSFTGDFSDANSFTVSGTSRQFVFNTTTPLTAHFRVAPIGCPSSSAFGPVARTVILPQQAPTSKEFDILVPLGTTTEVTQTIRFEGLTPGARFTATTDRPYLTLTPASGVVASDGSATVTVRGNPRDLLVGANTGTVSLELTTQSGSGGSESNAQSTTVSAPVSISLVTPVSQTAKSAAGATDAIVIPAVAHLEGLATFRSDVRLANTGTTPVTYLLTFTPQNTDGTTTGRQTTMTVQPEQTVALNDILRGYFGFALPSDSAGGVLEIRALSGSLATTYVSNRTYSTTATGTFGQFIPGVRTSKFLKAGAGALTLTQVAQSTAFRSNIGLVEGLGAAASGRLRVFNPSGQHLGDFPFLLRPFEFTQLGSFLATQGITLPEARIEIVNDSGSGGVTTYASVLDNRTQDPLLVSPVQTSTVTANRYVLPGMAEFTSSFSNFHSDVRVYNPSPFSVAATLTYYPQGTPANTIVRNEVILPGETKVYDNVLPTLFNTTGGGAIVVTTPANSSLIVSGRTYSNSSAPTGGTFGQFIPAVTPAEGIGLNDPPLQVLQLEQSKGFRTNIGLSELTGNPVTVRVVLHLPDSRVTPSTEVPLQANEFRQLGGIIGQLVPGNTYNARVTVQVVAGSGRVTAYGSVVDNNSSDPTYVPAQR